MYMYLLHHTSIIHYSQLFTSMAKDEKPGQRQPLRRSSFVLDDRPASVPPRARPTPRSVCLLATRARESGHSTGAGEKKSAFILLSG